MNKLNKIFKISILICLIVSFLSFVGCTQIERIRKDFLKEEKTGKDIPLESTKISEELKLESEQILNLCFNEEPLTIDPNLANSRASINIINQIFVGLTKLEPDLSVSPCIAENWEISDDGTIITFTIREDAYWTNGDHITAHDFVYSWKRT
ncbi:MAG: ABC transporter substrate-binding protein, partial [Actinomycetota bacterium]